ncbi:MAG: hypothetical protein RL186_1623 [Pseudomonadota bacterium]|jgi:N-acyl-L-homoserine lactone synthetase
MRTYVIDNKNRHAHQNQLTQMFCHRKVLFVDRLGWANMVVQDGQERDEADGDKDVVYLITTDHKGAVVGSCRLTPTTGECLLGGPLASYLEAPIARNETSWELTRFAPSSDPADPLHGRSFACLATGVLEWALANGVDKVFGIAEPPLMAIAGGLGWRVTIEGPPVAYETGKAAFAFSFPVDEATITSTKTALRIEGAVLSIAPNRKEEAA